MLNIQVATARNPARDNLSQTLEARRAEIDAIDDAILDLMEQRLACARAVAAIKADSGEPSLALHPRRETEVLTRLGGRASAMPKAALRTIWRELMAVSLQAQRRTIIAVAASRQPVLVARALADHFGNAAPVVQAPDAADALDCARDRGGIAVIELHPLSDWWIALVEERQLRIFDAVRDADGRIIALCAGRMAGGSIREGRYPILSARSFENRIAQGEKLRAVAVCGQIRLCVREDD